jgi:hypothetical protein
LGIAQQDQEHPKGFRLDGQDLACLDETELPFANLDISEAEKEGLTAYHQFPHPRSGTRRPKSVVSVSRRFVNRYKKAESSCFRMAGEHPSGTDPGGSITM